MFSHIQCNLSEQGMAACVSTRAIKLLLIYYTRDNIMETMFHSCQYIDATWWNHNRTQAIKVLTHSAIWICLYFGRHFVYCSKHLIMICAVYASMTWSSQDQMHKLQSFIPTTSLNCQKVCGSERHFLIHHLEIRDLLLQLLSGST